MDLTIRPRRLRGSDTLRRMVRETRLDPASLIYPMFVMDGENRVEEISALPGQYRYTVDRMEEELIRLSDAGVDKVMFFGIPAVKDEIGSQAYNAEGIVQRALRRAKKNFPDLYLITDVCMCEYTSHGHCGMLCGCDVDNDKTLELLSMTALSHVEAGADMVAPSDMMDGRVRAIRETLDAAGHTATPIMSYAVHRSCPTQSNMHLPSTDLSVRPQAPHPLSETARATRWISTTAMRLSAKPSSMWRKAQISSWSSPPCPTSTLSGTSVKKWKFPWPPTA